MLAKWREPAESRVSGSPAGCVLAAQPDGECTCSRRFTTVTTVTATHAIAGTQLSRTATQPENYIDRKCCVQLKGKVET
jgi:tellurite resistance protein